jgi:hypothetical protein
MQDRGLVGRAIVVSFPLADFNRQKESAAVQGLRQLSQDCGDYNRRRKSVGVQPTILRNAQVKAEGVP